MQLTFMKDGCARQQSFFLFTRMVTGLFASHRNGTGKLIVRTMKLTAFVLLIFALQVSATGVSQTVTFSGKNVPLEKVFTEVEAQSGYVFFYNRLLLKDSKPVNIQADRIPLDQFLQQLLKNQPFKFLIENNNIIISAKSPATIAPVNFSDLLSIKAPIKGIIRDAANKPLAGINVIIKGTQRGTVTNADGQFTIDAVPGDILLISAIGFEKLEVKITDQTDYAFKLKLQSAVLDTAAVTFISTGYETLSKDRATGAFTHVDNALINRSVSTNILDRLNGVASGIIFNLDRNKQYHQSTIEIRGRATLFSDPNPLIVVDNFPYDGDAANINPNDIESITVLKDAAAASAWGSRSGNGVIVITTKKGSLNSVPKISFTANVNVGEKPDLFYQPRLSSGDIIDIEQFLFNKGAFNNTINNGFGVLSPAVEIFLAKRKGSITAADSAFQINTLKGYDFRDQLLKYYYKPVINQQYQTSISGGGANQKYFVSAGYDRNQNGVVRDNYDRVTLNASNTYYFFKNKLELFSNIQFAAGNTNRSTAVGTTGYAYGRFADENGNPLAIANGMRTAYADTVGNGKLLNWSYSPLEELNNGYSMLNLKSTNYKVNVALNYNIGRGLKAMALYGYEKGIIESRILNEQESFFTRSQINMVSQLNRVTGAVTYPIPLGAIVNSSLQNIVSKNGRFQLNYNNTWNAHSVSVLAGTEIRDNNSFSNNNQLYGYNTETATNQNSAVDYTKDFPNFYGDGTRRIPTGTSSNGSTNRFFSYYFNGSYTYANKYIASVSARRDESNLFGVAANQKGVPLWSAGLAWVINKEIFYNETWLPELKLRATYGYTGTINNSISAYLTAVRGTFAQPYNAPYNEIINPPNPSLRWEKTRNINIGIDFASRKNRISGSIDAWQKEGLDLIGNSPIAPQTGIIVFTGNSANTLTKGVDVQLNSVNLKGALTWQTTLLYNYTINKVTRYKVPNGTNYNVVSTNYNNPLENYPYYAIFSFRYAGVDATGNPVGYSKGKTSTDYTAIMNSDDRTELVFNGSAAPTSFGSLRNTFTYKGFDLSFNITYKFGYYFRRPSVTSGKAYGASYDYPDYEQRWQKPGDELVSNVPKLVYPSNFFRDAIYQYSDVLVQKGDHIRFQDFRFGYTIREKRGLPFSNLNLFAYVNNIGIIWRANQYKIDPDAQTSYPAMKTVAFGVKAEF